MDESYLFHEDLTQLAPDVPSDSILSRTFHEDERLKAILFSFAAGQELSEHTASQPAILHFLSGEADLTLGGDELQAGPGTWAWMPARLTHSVVARTPVTMLLLLYKE
jgi:quercetin dioxygenase-like cupin family protein